MARCQYKHVFFCFNEIYCCGCFDYGMKNTTTSEASANTTRTFRESALPSNANFFTTWSTVVFLSRSRERSSQSHKTKMRSLTTGAHVCKPIHEYLTGRSLARLPPVHDTIRCGHCQLLVTFIS